MRLFRRLLWLLFDSDNGRIFEERWNLPAEVRSMRESHLYTAADFVFDSLQDGNGRARLRQGSPQSEQILVGIGKRTDDRDGFDFCSIQRQGILFISQEH